MLSAEEFAELTVWAGGAAGARLAERARIVLACAEGLPTVRVAAKLGVTADTARKWRTRVAERRMEAVAAGPRPGGPVPHRG
ncbi:helix-turn-helix domain-containing protein [Streptomyces sp. NPDC058471]|uniref:helix-turn-helix domain-containing protein n=1 Tax=Streptomyces sp. NPDC058471 TaxID=3346516 RepID=UPI003652BCCA